MLNAESTSEEVQEGARSVTTSEDDDEVSVGRVSRRMKVCRVCGRKFASSARLVSHMRKHREKALDEKEVYAKIETSFDVPPVSRVTNHLQVH